MCSSPSRPSARCSAGSEPTDPALSPRLTRGLVSVTLRYCVGHAAPVGERQGGSGQIGSRDPFRRATRLLRLPGAALRFPRWDGCSAPATTRSRRCGAAGAGRDRRSRRYRSGVADFRHHHARCHADLGWTQSACGARRLSVDFGDGGAPTVVSGSVFTPLGEPPTDGWPVVAIGHGTVGIDGPCGPSLSPWLQGALSFVAPLIAKGFAVSVADFGAWVSGDTSLPGCPDSRVEHDRLGASAPARLSRRGLRRGRHSAIRRVEALPGRPTNRPAPTRPSCG